MTTFTYKPENIVYDSAGIAGATGAGSGVKLSAAQTRSYIGLATTDVPTFAGLSLGGNLLFSSDNSYDIGAYGATRARTAYIGTSVVTPWLDNPSGTLTIGNASQKACFAGRLQTKTGSSSAPAITGSDSNSGLYWRGSDDIICFATNGIPLITMSDAYTPMYNINLASGLLLGWSSNANPESAFQDSAFARVSAGVVELNNGTRISSGGSLATLNASAINNPTSALSLGNITTGITSVGKLVFTSDNSYDIGASAATRPRTVYVGTSVITPLVNNASAALTLGNSTYGVTVPGGATITGGGVSNTGGVKIGSLGEINGGIWDSGVTPSTENYSLATQNTGNSTYLNATTTILLRINNVSQAVVENGQLYTLSDLAMKKTSAQGYIYAYYTDGAKYIRMYSGSTSAMLHNNTGRLYLQGATSLSLIAVSGDIDLAPSSGNVYMAGSGANGNFVVYDADASHSTRIQNDGTNGIVSTSSGALVLSPSNGDVNIYGNHLDTHSLNIPANASGFGWNVTRSATDYVECVAGGVIKGIRAYGSVPFTIQTDAGSSILLNSGTNLYNFGASTSSRPAIKVSSTTLEVKLGDDSAYAPLACAGITASGAITTTNQSNQIVLNSGGTGVSPTIYFLRSGSGDGTLTVSNSFDFDKQITSSASISSSTATGYSRLAGAGQLWLSSTSGNSQFIYFIESGAAVKGTLGFANGSAELQFRAGATTMSDGTKVFGVGSTGNVTCAGITASGIVTAGAYAGPAAGQIRANSAGAVSGVGMVIALNATDYTEYLHGGVVCGVRGNGSVPMILGHQAADTKVYSGGIELLLDYSESKIISNSPLDVSGNVAITGTTATPLTVNTASASSGIYFNQTTTGNHYFGLQYSGATKWLFGNQYTDHSFVWYNAGAASVVASLSQTGNLTINGTGQSYFAGSIGIGVNPAVFARLEVLSSATGAVVSCFRGVSGQTANLANFAQWSGTVVASVGANGEGTFASANIVGALQAGSGLIQASSANLQLNSTSTSSYSSLEFLEDLAGKTYLYHYNSTYATTALRDHFAIMNTTSGGGVLVYTNTTKRIETTSTGTTIFYKSILGSEVTSTPSGTTQTVTLSDGNHQTLSLASSTGDVTVTLTVPSSSAAGTLLVVQHATTARDITWAASAGSIVWLGTEPTWNTDATSSIRMITWRYNGTNTYLSASGASS